MPQNLQMMEMGGSIEGFIAPGPVINALRTQIGLLGVDAVTHDALKALLEIVGGLAQSIKPLENIIRSDPAVIGASQWVQNLANKLKVNYNDALNLVQAIHLTDAASDSLVFMVRPSPDLFDPNRLASSINNGAVELKWLKNLDVYIACPKHGTLPLVAGMDASPQNAPDQLLRLAARLGRRTRQKGLFGTDRAYIRVTRLEGHCDPSLIIMPDKAYVIVYGDWLNGLATVIKAIVSGKARYMVFYDFP